MALRCFCSGLLIGIFSGVTWAAGVISGGPLDSFPLDLGGGGGQFFEDLALILFFRDELAASTSSSFP